MEKNKKVKKIKKKKIIKGILFLLSELYKKKDLGGILWQVDKLEIEELFI